MRVLQSGLGVVNATPFDDDGQVNREVYRSHLDWMVHNGVDFVTPAAATGEFIALTDDERQQLVELAAETIGPDHVISYIGRATTQETIAALEHSKAVGVRAAYVVQPWFMRPSQDGLFEHFRQVAAEAGDLPLILYNNPDRTSCSITTATMRRVVDELPQFQAIKDADNNSLPDTLAEFGERMQIWPRSEREMMGPLAMGAPGILTFTGNFMPRELASIIRAWQEGRLEDARHEYLRIYPLIRLALSYPFPTSIKFAMQLAGFDFGTPRLPILPLDRAGRDQVSAAWSAIRPQGGMDSSARGDRGNHD